jgi:hypothetical protein
MDILYITCIHDLAPYRIATKYANRSVSSKTVYMYVNGAGPHAGEHGHKCTQSAMQWTSYKHMYIMSA